MTLRPVHSAVAAPVGAGSESPAAPPAEAPAIPVDGFRASEAAPASPTRPSWTWGRKGHDLAVQEAVLALPEGMPDFFAKNVDWLANLGNLPDRWKFRELPHLQGANVPDHYMNYESVAGKDLPADRYAYVKMLADEAPGTDARPPQFNGTLPYRLAETFETLVADMALLHMEKDRDDQDGESPQLPQLEKNVLYTAGILSHFVADATQPLHSTVHHDGWNEAFEPNPDNFRSKPGLHRQFETYLVNEAVTAEEVRRRVGPAALIEEDPLQVGLSLIKESHALVRPLYRLEAEGKLDPLNPHREGVDLAADRLARATQVLRDLWYSAWVRSEAIARREGSPQREGRQDEAQGFLLAAHA